MQSSVPFADGLNNSIQVVVIALSACAQLIVPSAFTIGCVFALKVVPPAAVPFKQAGKVLNSERVQSSDPLFPELKRVTQDAKTTLTGFAQLRVPSENVSGP